ncbi:MAG: alpha-L-fucosidase [Armatimonadetes bacterium]|nr:alpha-L-fucosidase [Armatimonadota bacterium]
MLQPWFHTAKLGIFIHWGIYAVNGTSESWSFFNGETTYDEYMAQRHGFTASRYDPDAWANLFKKAGARYAVLTAKHHDGVALFDTQLSDLSVVKQTLAGRDLIRPYCESLRKVGVKVGLYFSHLDWSHPDYASIGSNDATANRYAYRQGESDMAAWQRFLAFHRGQIQEICTQYGEIDLIWFDGDWERDADTWDMAGLRRQIEAWQPNAILNSRMRGHGDYDTPEQGLPLEAPDGPWEFCMTINDNWGYRPIDRNYKTPEQVIQIFCDVIGGGGNLLLDIGPMEDGTIPPEQVDVLERLGDWIGRHQEAVYETIRGLLKGYHGASTRSIDGQCIFLFVPGRPGQIYVKGLMDEVKKATLLGSGVDVTHKRIGGAPWSNIPGTLWIDIPDDAVEPCMSVVRLELA